MKMSPREHETLMLILRSVGHYSGREVDCASLRRQVMTGPEGAAVGGDISIDAVMFKPAKGKSA